MSRAATSVSRDCSRVRIPRKSYRKAVDFPRTMESNQGAEPSGGSMRVSHKGFLLVTCLLASGMARADEPPAGAGQVAPAGSTTSAGSSQNALQVRNEFTGRNGLGVAVGLPSGIGIAYRRYLNDRIALRGAG